MASAYRLSVTVSRVSSVPVEHVAGQDHGDLRVPQDLGDLPGERADVNDSFHISQVQRLESPAKTFGIIVRDFRVDDLIGSIGGFPLNSAHDLTGSRVLSVFVFGDQHEDLGEFSRTGRRLGGTYKGPLPGNGIDQTVFDEFSNGVSDGALAGAVGSPDLLKGGYLLFPGQFTLAYLPLDIAVNSVYECYGHRLTFNRQRNGASRRNGTSLAV